MKNRIPQTINIHKLAHDAVTLKAEIDVMELERLGDFLHPEQPKSEFLVSLYAKADTANKYYLNLELKGEVNLICQRCLEKVPFTIDKEIELIALKNIKDFASEEGQYEPILLDNTGKASLYDIITDEIILSLPQVPKHSVSECDPDLIKLIKT